MAIGSIVSSLLGVQGILEATKWGLIVIRQLFDGIATVLKPIGMAMNTIMKQILMSDELKLISKLFSKIDDWATKFKKPEMTALNPFEKVTEELEKQEKLTAKIANNITSIAEMAQIAAIEKYVPEVPGPMAYGKTGSWQTGGGASGSWGAGASGSWEEEAPKQTNLLIRLVTAVESGKAFWR